jgi:hypothetical protein
MVEEHRKNAAYALRIKKGYFQEALAVNGRKTAF